MKQKVMFYCQHVLGMGHLVRSIALVEGLSREFEVCFVNGGEIVKGFALPQGVQIENLPSIKSDQDFTQLEGQEGQNLQQIQQARLNQLLQCYERFQPDLVVIELFPIRAQEICFRAHPAFSTHPP